MKGLSVLLAGGAAAAALAAPAGASTGVQVTIRHQMMGCHSWAIGSGRYNPTQSISVRAGTAFTFTNDDVMSHALKQLTGPKVAISTPLMNTMGAHARIVFSRRGTYVFTTKPGEDYTKGVVTKGEDNVLRLVVTVR